MFKNLSGKNVKNLYSQASFHLFLGKYYKYPKIFISNFDSVS
jgi:hypothetical protein